MQTVTVQTSPPYPVHIGPGLLKRAGELIAGAAGSRTCAVITDTTVEKLYAAVVCRSLQEAGFQVCLRAFPAGERHKNLTTYAGILEFFAQSRLTRSDLVLALGGGVTGDMAGFAAATYQRGVDYIQLPTTLLAASDSSVGGKTAVDLAAGKNLAGAFHQPKMVLCDTDTFRTLPADTCRKNPSSMTDQSQIHGRMSTSWRPFFVSFNMQISGRERNSRHFSCHPFSGSCPSRKRTS